MPTNITSEFLLKPIMPWFEEKGVSEILLNEPGIVFVERSDGFYRYEIPEFDEKRLMQLFRLIANENHQELHSKKPLLSGVLKNGSRIQLIIPPISESYAFCIRIKQHVHYELEKLNENNFFEKTFPFCIKNKLENISEMDEALLSFYRQGHWMDFIKLALESRKNIVVSGATSSGKTTFINACLNQLSLSERLLILEDTPEIEVKHENKLRLVAYKDQQGLSNVSLQDLVQCSLRLRPDRIIVGEVRGKELLDYIGASLTGHSGSMISIHAENPRIAFIRMCQMYKLNTLPAMTDQNIYDEIKQAVDIIFQLKRISGGRRLESVYWKDFPIAEI